MFGFTQDESRYLAAIAWRDAATADGWIATPTYENESIERASTLKREGFLCQIYSRTDVGRFKYEASISIWGPDGLAILPPNTYLWDVIKGAIATCGYCYKVDVPTQRVGFAGRCCSDCITEVRKKVEFPGWCN